MNKNVVSVLFCVIAGGQIQASSIRSLSWPEGLHTATESVRTFVLEHPIVASAITAGVVGGVGVIVWKCNHSVAQPPADRTEDKAGKDRKSAFPLAPVAQGAPAGQEGPNRRRPNAKGANVQWPSDNVLASCPSDQAAAAQADMQPQQRGKALEGNEYNKWVETALAGPWVDAAEKDRFESLAFMKCLLISQHLREKRYTLEVKVSGSGLCLAWCDSGTKNLVQPVWGFVHLSESKACALANLVKTTYLSEQATIDDKIAMNNLLQGRQLGNPNLKDISWIGSEIDRLYKRQ